MEDAARGDGRSHALAGGEASRGVMDQQRHLHQLLGHAEAVAHVAALAVGLAMVRHDDDLRIFQRAHALQRLKKPPQLFVLLQDFGVVGIQQGLALVRRQRRLRRQGPARGAGVEATHMAPPLRPVPRRDPTQGCAPRPPGQVGAHQVEEDEVARVRATGALLTIPVAEILDGTGAIALEADQPRPKWRQARAQGGAKKQARARAPLLDGLHEPAPGPA